MRKPKDDQPDYARRFNIAIAVIVIALLGLGFSISRLELKDVPQIDPSLNRQSQAQGQCRAPDPTIASAPADLRGSTLIRPWQPFDKFGHNILAEMRTEEKVAADVVPGGQAIRIAIKRAGRNPYDFGVSLLNARQIRRDETIIAKVWLRATSTENPSKPAVIFAKLQDNASGFRRLKEEPLTLTSRFQLYEIRSPIFKDYCPNDLNFALHLATGRQTIEVGPAFLITTK